MIVFLRKWILKIAYWLFTPLPVRERVVFASSHAVSLGGNLRAIRDELQRRTPSPEIVTHLRRSVSARSSKLDTLMHAVRAEYLLATSRVFIVDDYFFPLYVITPKPDTVVIQTWHASGAFKKIGYSVLGRTFGASSTLVRQVRIHSNYTYCLIASKNAIPAYAEAFGQPAERFVSLGIPRTDLFFDAANVARTAVKLRERYRLPADKRVILYAPTFKGTSTHAAAYHDDLDLRVMRDLLGDDYVLLLRLHPFVARSLTIPADLGDFARNVSDYRDINELMLVSDVLVTDYSSAIFEYSLLERPMAFLAPDHEAYEAERGFYFDYASEVPGPVFDSTEALAHYLAAGRFDTQRAIEFKERSFDMADGHASERVVDRLVLPALSASAGVRSSRKD